MLISLIFALLLAFFSPSTEPVTILALLFYQNFTPLKFITKDWIMDSIYDKDCILYKSIEFDSGNSHNNILMIFTKIAIKKTRPILNGSSFKFDFIYSAYIPLNVSTQLFCLVTNFFVQLPTFLFGYQLFCHSTFIKYLYFILSNIIFSVSIRALGAYSPTIPSLSRSCIYLYNQ